MVDPSASKSDTGQDASVAGAGGNTPTPVADSTSGLLGAEAIPSATAGASGRPILPIAFDGIAGDYFRIWIVNLLLTLVTLGLWSPWAKVRKRRYLYGHTWLAGANFEYHANPVAILRGRLIAAAAIGVYWVFENLVPNTAPWLLAALLGGAPWIVTRSLRFNAANSSHRGIRFRFSGATRDVAFAIWPLALTAVAFVAVSKYSLDILAHPFRYVAQMAAVSIAFMAAYPYTVAQIRRLMVAKSAWGDQAFNSALRTGRVYAIYLTCAALCLIPLIVGAVVGIAVGVAVFKLAKDDVNVVATLSALFYAITWAATLIVWVAYSRSRMTNLVLNTSRLSHIARLNSAISATKLAKLYGVNVLAILCSGGLLIPWAVIRVTRYRLQTISVEIEGPLTTVASAVIQTPRATGEELGEMFGFDLAL
jgi:uncharacterized membrane protein YjgN (DUF898 family)